MPLDITPFLPLAAPIARSFSNIPGLDFREIDLCAQEALAAAARKFDPTKGDFAPYAAQAVRNALCGLYEKPICPGPRRLFRPGFRGVAEILDELKATSFL